MHASTFGYACVRALTSAIYIYYKYIHIYIHVCVHVYIYIRKMHWNIVPSISSIFGHWSGHVDLCSEQLLYDQQTHCLSRWQPFSQDLITLPCNWVCLKNMWWGLEWSPNILRQLQCDWHLWAASSTCKFKSHCQPTPQWGSWYGMEGKTSRLLRT